MSTVRDFNFYWSNINKDATLVLTFVPPKGYHISSEQNQVAWNIVKIKKGSGYSNTIRYEATIGVGIHTDTEANQVGSASFIPIKLGQKAVVDSSGAWTPPVTEAALRNLINVKNDSGDKINLSVGTIDRKGNYNPTFFWKSVGATNKLEIDFHPTLYAFVNLDYQKGEVFTGDITSDRIWDRNLADLSGSTSWTFREEGNGSYNIASRA